MPVSKSDEEKLRMMNRRLIASGMNPLGASEIEQLLQQMEASGKVPDAFREGGFVNDRTGQATRARRATQQVP